MSSERPSRFRQFIQNSAIFVLGIVIGTVLYNAVYHNRFNILWIENKDLQIQLHQAEEDNRTLRKYNKHPTVIKEIKIRLEQQDPPIDSLAVKEVVQQLHQELEVLRGRNMFDIDSDSKMTRTLLNRKIYSVREKEYSIQIKTMLVSEGVLQIWIEVKPYVRSQ